MFQQATREAKYNVEWEEVGSPTLVLNTCSHEPDRAFRGFRSDLDQDDDAALVICEVLYTTKFSSFKELLRDYISDPEIQGVICINFRQVTYETNLNSKISKILQDSPTRTPSQRITTEWKKVISESNILDNITTHGHT